MTASDCKEIVQKKEVAELKIETLGDFRVWRNDEEIGAKAWKRERALQLFQFFITVRRSTPYLHKEQIIDRLWPELEMEEGDRDFKVALHNVNKVLEPERKPRATPRFIQRQGLTYGFSLHQVWIDADAFEELLAMGNRLHARNPEAAITCYQEALALYKGDFLPERRYEDWSSAEGERLQLLALGLMTTLAKLLLDRTPLESIRLTQRALTIDPVWEDAYRTQMLAYMAQGNRPLALRTYQQCVEALDQELSIAPLPETQQLISSIKNPSSSD